MKRLKAIACALVMTCSAFAQTQYIHIHEANQGVRSIEHAQVESMQYDADGTVTILHTDGSTENVPFGSLTHWRIGSDVPVVRINTVETVDEVPDKENYLKATISIDGRGVVPDFTGDVSIRGRGNTTWQKPKKPYRLKFDKKTELGGLAKAKNFVLLANWIDPSEMRNAVAMRIGEMLSIPYTNSMVPVEVYFNDDYRGTYMLTEKIGINGASVDIDEDESVLFELDKYFDEEWRFKTPNFNLPAMIKDPDMTDELFSEWQADFNHMEDTVDSYVLGGEDHVWDEIDIDSAVRYFMVYNLVLNCEIRYPKSVYMYKTKGRKYHFGPLWDFDWAFGYLDPLQHTLVEDGDNLPGRIFFTTLMKHPDFIKEYAHVWDEFKPRIPELFEFIDDYAAHINASGHRDALRWPERDEKIMADHEQSLVELKEWLRERIEYVSNPATNYGLFE